MAIILIKKENTKYKTTTLPNLFYLFMTSIRKYIFSLPKENITIGALMLLIIMTFVMINFQNDKSSQDSEYPNTTSKAKRTTPNQTEVPHFLPAL